MASDSKKQDDFLDQDNYKILERDTPIEVVDISKDKKEKDKKNDISEEKARRVESFINKK